MAKVIILYGPPGSGKGTLANLLSRNFNFVNFDTGQHLRELLYNPKFFGDKTIKKERLLNQSGKLNTPSFVLGLVSKAAKKIAAVGGSIIFTGSPRTALEAFGDKTHKGLIEILLKLYGRKNIFIFELKVSRKTSIKRNSHREICSICGQPSLFLYTGKTPCCAVCAGPFKKRKDDNPKVFETRLTEYQNRTRPIFKILEKRGYRIFQINGELAPYKDYRQIISKIK